MPTNAALKFKFTPNKFDAKVYELITLWDYAGQLAQIIDNFAPEGRLKSVAFTDLEKAIAVAQRAITEG
jgi:hypothetical protein